MIKKGDNIHKGIEKLAGAQRVSRLLKKYDKVKATDPYGKVYAALQRATKKYERRMQGRGGTNLQKLIGSAEGTGKSPAQIAGVGGTVKAIGVDAPRAIASQIAYNRKAGVPMLSNISLSEPGAQNIARQVAKNRTRRL